MSRTVPAIYDAGVFRPLQPVDLAQGTHVEVQVPATPPRESTAELSPEEIAHQQAAWAKFIARMEAIPFQRPDDGFSGRDHDKILYGKP